MATGEDVMRAARVAEERTARSVWLHAWHDPVASLKAFTPCVRFADLSGDGDSKMLVASADKKLKIYTGTTLLSENVLLDAPASICTFYPDAKGSPRVPSVAVAAGPFVFIYRNLRPWYKFSLPQTKPHADEEAAWADMHSGAIDVQTGKERLNKARDDGLTLSSTTQELLAIDEPAAADTFVQEQRDKPLATQTVATCMETLKKDIEEDDAVSMLVVGTENGMVLVLDQTGSNIVKQWQLPSAPVYMAITGSKDIEFRIVCACRDGNIHTIKENGPSGIVIELESMPCGLVRLDKSIVVRARPCQPPHACPLRPQSSWQARARGGHAPMRPLPRRLAYGTIPRAPPPHTPHTLRTTAPQVGCMSNTVHAFSLRGKKSYSIYLPAPIVNMELLSISRSRVAKALLVAMSTGEVRLYAEKHLLAQLRINEPVTACRFGCYGREEGCLAVIGASGSLTIKILQRTTRFDATSAAVGPPPEQDVPLSIPKKTNLYVEQTQREREQATEMHRIFQRDLCKLRLSTARAYVKMITDGQGPMSYSSGSALRLTAQVQGLGPRFKIKISLQNTGSKHVADLLVALNYNALLYRLKTSVFTVPCLVPGVAYRLDAELECTDENGTSDTVKVYVCAGKSKVPVLSAVVNMPVSEHLLSSNAS